MAFRIIARFLAFFVFWSGLGAIEPVHALGLSSTEPHFAMTHSVGASAANEGSVEHHHLDDLPTQVQYEPLTETSGLLPGMPKAREPWLSMMLPLASVAVPEESPYLAGPLRPPCGVARAA